jgi:hypothetical protein
MGQRCPYSRTRQPQALTLSQCLSAVGALSLRESKVVRPINKKNPPFRGGFVYLRSWQCPTLAWSCHTTIGAESFHFRVRDGNGWFQLANAARKDGSKERSERIAPSKLNWSVVEHLKQILNASVT